MAVILVGNDVINRASYRGGNVTIIDLNYPADGTGTIKSVSFRSASYGMDNVTMGIFYLESGTKYSTRSYAYLIDVASSNTVYTFDVNLPVQQGDFIGIYFEDSIKQLEATVGGSARWTTGNQFPCTNKNFEGAYTNTFSIQGTGVTAGWAHKWNGITIGKWNGVVISKLNGIA